MPGKKPKVYTMLIVDAVERSSLPKDTRHLLDKMAYRANHDTGEGWLSQETLAVATGMSERQVRRIMAELSAPGATPVRLERTPRFRQDGRGRTSDVWRLVLVDNQAASQAGYSPEQPATVAGRTKPTRSRLTGQGSTTNRPGTSRLTGPPVRGSSECDPQSDPRSSSASTGEAVPLRLVVQDSKNPKPKGHSNRKASSKRAIENPTEHAKVVAFYFETFERVRGAKPFFGKPEGNAVKKLLAKCQGNAEQAIEVILNALESWKGNTVTILQIASDPSQFAAPAPPRKTGRTARSMQPNAEGSPFNPTDYTHHDDDEEAAAAP